MFLGIRAWFAKQSLRPDLGRGVRCMLSFMAPLLLSFYGRLPVEIAFAALAAQSIANVDVRGAYSLRLTLLLSKSIVIASAAALGALTGHPLALALGATVLIAACGGLWRHLSSDYGPSLAIASSLIFFIAVSSPGGKAVALQHFEAAFLGGAWGVLLQVAFWPIRPQHPLRVAVSDAWLAAADLATAIATPATAIGPKPPKYPFAGVIEVTTEALGPPMSRHLSAVGTAEAQLRLAIERSYQVLSIAAQHRSSALIGQLEELTRVAARFAVRVSAFQSAREAAAAAPLPFDFASSSAPFLVGLQNLPRTVALAVVSGQPAHLAAADVRFHRLRNLARVLRGSLDVLGSDPRWKAVSEAVHEIENYLPNISDALRVTVGRAGEHGAISFELFDLHDLTLRPLASSLNLTTRVEPALVRFTVRIASLTLLGVLAIKLVQLPHGYWLPFTMVVVLQPDYGSTRQRAAQRLLGTLGGSILASLLLSLHPPTGTLMGAIALCCFVFGYYLKRNYAFTVIFITIFVVALTEANAPQTLALTAERMGSTLAGGLLALIAALVFWPVWERDRVRPIIARALRANAEFLQLAAEVETPAGRPDSAVIVAQRREVESANADMFSSLQRMAGDPKSQQDRLERLAAIANGNQRITRAINLDLLRGVHGPAPAAERSFTVAARTELNTLADQFESTLPASGTVPSPQEIVAPPPQFARLAAELGAMRLTADELANRPASAS